jgi:CelD/BcsL family acetyltransferase involved in cellulose biosynthesis
MKIEVFSSFNSELEKIWRNFEVNAFDSPFQSYSWLFHWQYTVGELLHSIIPQIVIVRNEGIVVAIFPMGIRKLLSVTILEWLGGLHTDYMGPLISKKWDSIEKEFPLCWQETVNKLIQFDVIHFQKQKEHCPLLNPFVKAMDCHIKLMSYQSNLNNSWKDHYENTIKTKLRADSRRQSRRLAEFGEVCFVVAEDKQTKLNFIEKMMQQKSRRYNDTGVWDMLSVPEHKDFYKKLAAITADDLKIHCAALTVGDMIVATHVGIYDESTFYYLMPAHESGDWERYSPGRLLLEYLLEWSINNQLKIFDFTVGGEHYKRDWCDTETPLYETLQAFTPKGKMYLMAQQAKQTIKQMPRLGENARQLNAWLKNKKYFEVR